jgi:hypothetical protein
MREEDNERKKKKKRRERKKKQLSRVMAIKDISTTVILALF